MREINNRSSRRAGVIITFAFLLLSLILFEESRITGFTIFKIIFNFVLGIIFLTGFIFTYLKTGIWRFIHQPFEKYDEREIELAGKSLRYSYSIFTVSILIFLLLVSLSDFEINIQIVAVLIFMAHLIPASIIAWTQKEI
jgi:hypothetical protein